MPSLFATGCVVLFSEREWLTGHPISASVRSLVNGLMAFYGASLFIVHNRKHTFTASPYALVQVLPDVQRFRTDCQDVWKLHCRYFCVADQIHLLNIFETWC